MLRLLKLGIIGIKNKFTQQLFQVIPFLEFCLEGRIVIGIFCLKSFNFTPMTLDKFIETRVLQRVNCVLEYRRFPLRLFKFRMVLRNTPEIPVIASGRRVRLRPAGGENRNGRAIRPLALRNQIRDPLPSGKR